MKTQNLIVTIKEAQKMGIQARITTAVSIKEARDGALDGTLADHRRAGKRAVMVIVKGNHERGEVEVWAEGKRKGTTPPCHSRRYHQLRAEGRCTTCTAVKDGNMTGSECLKCADARRALRKQRRQPQTNQNHA